MPTYEYACESCGNRYEKREGFDALARQKCPKCKKTAQRVLFAPPVVFKGSGFYKTDNRGSSPASSDASPTPAPPAAAGGHSHDAPTPSTESAATTTATTETAAAS